jgi:putative membrane protein
MVNASFDAAGQARVSAAIEAAENRTAGEIFVVVARQSERYEWTMMVWAAGVALLAPLGLLFAGVDPLEVARALQGGWRSGHDADLSGDAATGMAIVVALQAFLFLAVSALSLWPAARENLTPRFVKRGAVHRSALEQFLGHGIHLTEARTGVLIYVSLAERLVEVVADTGIYARVDKSVWSGAVAALLEQVRAGDLAEGLVRAVTAAGDVLAVHFPPRPDDQDELPNAVVLL